MNDVILDLFQFPTDFGDAVELHERVLAIDAFDDLNFEWNAHRSLISSKLAIILMEGEVTKADC